jgi:hypothetical protein
MLPALLLELQRQSGAAAAGGSGANRAFAEQQGVRWRDAAVGALRAYLELQREPWAAAAAALPAALPAAAAATPAPATAAAQLQAAAAAASQVVAAAHSFPLSSRGGVALSQLRASLSPAQALTLIDTASALTTTAGGGGAAAEPLLASLSTSVAAVAVAAQCCAATVWQAAATGEGYGSAAALVDGALTLLDSAAGRAAGLAAHHGVPLARGSAAVAAAAAGGGGGGGGGDLARIRAAMHAWGLGQQPADTPGTALHDIAATAALLSPRVVEARAATSAADVLLAAGGAGGAGSAARAHVRAAALAQLVATQEAFLGVAHLALLLSSRDAPLPPALAAGGGRAKQPAPAPALSAALSAALERICSIEGVRAAETQVDAQRSCAAPLTAAEADADARELTARLDAACRCSGGGGGGGATPFPDAADGCAACAERLLPVPPLSLLAPLLAAGRRFCALLRDLTPSALAAMAGTPHSGGGGGGGGGGSATAALASARLALVGLATVVSALAAYPSVQHPFIAQTAWPAVTALLPSAAWLRSAALALARHAAAARSRGGGSGGVLGAGAGGGAVPLSLALPLPSAGALTGAPAAAASLVDAREAAQRDARGGAPPLNVYGRTLQYLSARRGEAAAGAGAGAAPAPALAEASLLPPELSSPLVAAWLLAFGADVIACCAVLVAPPPCDGCAAAGGAWWWHSRAPGPDGGGGGGAPARIALGGCAGDFLRSRVEADLVPVLAAALHAALAQAVVAPRGGGLAWGQPFRALAAAACRAVAALARPQLVIPRDDTEAPLAGAAADGAEGGDADGAPPPPPPPPPPPAGAPLPPTMPLQFAASFAKSASAGADARRAALAAGCGAAPPLLGEGVAAARPLLATLAALHSFGGGAPAEAACAPGALHGLVGDALRALAAACELADAAA